MMYWVERIAWEKISLLDEEFDEWEYSQVIEPYSSNQHGQQTYTSKWLKRKMEEREEKIKLEEEAKKWAEEIKVSYLSEEKVKKRIDYANSLEVGMFISIDEDYAGHWSLIFENHTNFYYQTAHKDGCVIFYITGKNEKGRS